MSDHDNLHTAATIGLVNGAYDGYRTYQATGDLRHAGQTGMKSAGLTVACGTLGAGALFGLIGVLGAATAGNPAGAVLFLLATVLMGGLGFVLYRNYRVMMTNALRPRGALPTAPVARRRAIQPAPRPTSQYTFDLTTGKFHKHW